MFLIFYCLFYKVLGKSYGIMQKEKQNKIIIKINFNRCVNVNLRIGPKSTLLQT